MQRETATHRPDLPHQFIPVVEQCQLDECEICGNERAAELHQDHVALRERAHGPTLQTEKGV